MAVLRIGTWRVGTRPVAGANRGNGAGDTARLFGVSDAGPWWPDGHDTRSGRCAAGSNGEAVCSCERPAELVTGAGLPSPPLGQAGRGQACTGSFAAECSR